MSHSNNENPNNIYDEQNIPLRPSPTVSNLKTHIVILISLQVIFGVLLGLFGELLPPEIKTFFDYLASFIGLSYATFWLCCVAILIVISILIAVFIDNKRVRRNIKTVQDVIRHFNLPILGEIPNVNVKRHKSNLPYSLNISLAHYSLDRSRSIFAEKIRDFRTSLTLSKINKTPQTILFLSASPSEGKTTLSINTAISLAQTGADVVILDCDLRFPRLHQHFNFLNTHGITNYLYGDNNVENLLKALPQLLNLKVITSGPIPPNPSELLTSNKMRYLIEFLSFHFKYIIIDSPPSMFSDTTTLAPIVDAVIIVVDLKNSSAMQVKNLISRLKSLGGNIYGVVLNKVKYSWFSPLRDHNFYDYNDDD